jgi:hypothetical protein
MIFNHGYYMLEPLRDAEFSVAAILALLPLMAGITPALAIDLFEREGFTVGLPLELGIGSVLTDNTNFGAGRFDLLTGEATGDAQWFEGYVEPGLDLAYDTGGSGTVYGAASAIAALSRGDGDAGGFTSGDEEDVDVEYLYAGWRSGALFADGLGEDALEVSLGAQDFQVGDGFLIWDGDLDTGNDAVYWLAPRSAFDFAGVARLNTTPVSGQAFHLRGDDDQGHTELLGANADYDPGVGTLGATYLQIVDADAGFDADVPREGMQVVSLRVAGLHWPDLEDLALHAEVAKQFGDGANAEFDAEAFYVEPSYTFSWLPWSPSLAYRFAYFSGDPDPANDDREDFDPLFYDMSRNWGTWVQGEITGQYLLFNSNQVNHMVHLSALPAESVAIGLLYFHFDLAEKNYFGTPVSDKDFADEVNLYFDWTVNDNLLVGALYGAALPQDAAKEIFGDDDVFHLLEVYATLTF